MFGSIGLANAGRAGSSDVFLAKLTDAGSTGNFIWVQRAGGADNETASAVTVSGANVYITGNFRGATTIFGSTTLVNAGPVGGADIFLAKLKDAGNTGSFVWAQQAGGPGAEIAQAVAVTGASVYVVGTYDSATATFGSTTLANTGNNSKDVVVAKVNDAGATGTFTWAQRAGGPMDDYTEAVTVSGSKVYVAGSVIPPSIFGSLSVASPVNFETSFLASLTDATLTPTRAAQAGPIVSLFPNPARTTATVVIPAQPGGATATLTLLDALGRTVRSQTAHVSAIGLRTELNLAGLRAGVYALRVVTDAGSTTRRLVVE